MTNKVNAKQITEATTNVKDAIVRIKIAAKKGESYNPVITRYASDVQAAREVATANISTTNKARMDELQAALARFDAALQA